MINATNSATCEATGSGSGMNNGIGMNGNARGMNSAGMNNNGTGMVLAASALVSLPWAVVPVLTYNLIQHVVAGGLSRSLAMREQGAGMESAVGR